jgi:tetratricopeptide (TPR) repeat protein
MKKSISFIVLILFLSAGGARAETKDGKEVEELSEEAREWIIKGMRVEEKNYDEMIKCYKKAIVVDPGSALLYRSLGIAYLKEGMMEEAISAYKKAVKIEPNNASTHYNLGTAYDEKGMLDEAISAYRKAVAIDFIHTKARFNLGTSYLKKGMLDNAISEYKKVIALNPNDADAHFNLGTAYGLKGLASLEADHLHKAGSIYFEQGNMESALEAYEGVTLIKSKELEQFLLEKLHPKEAEQ